MYISVLFIYILQIFGYDSLWYNCSIVIIFYFPCIPLFYSFVCSSHLCILSYMLVPYGAFFINKEFEFEFKTMIAYLIVDVKINFLVHYIKIKTMTFMFTHLVSSDFSYVNINF
jgi:hypothetical protein